MLASAQTGPSRGLTFPVPAHLADTFVAQDNAPPEHTPHPNLKVKVDQMNTLIDVAIADGHFKTRAKALMAAGLADTLQGAGPFTTFTPNDEAFATLPAGTLDGLPRAVPKLTAILKYPVLEGKVAAADVAKLDGKTVKALNGADLNGKVNEIKDDLSATNGLIHVVNSVPVP